MERLTHPRSSGIKTGYWSPKKKDELVERLAEYENTGLTPEEVVTVYDLEKSQAGKLLKELGVERKKHRWIPVEERLPEDPEEFVLVQVSGKPCPNIILEDALMLAVYGDEGWLLEEYPEWKGMHTIAWMPLPEPYREESEDE